MEAYRYRELDRREQVHYKAFVNRAVNSTKTVGSGKNQTQVYAYKRMSDLFKRDEQMALLGLNTAQGEKRTKAEVWRLVAQANKQKGE